VITTIIDKKLENPATKPYSNAEENWRGLNPTKIKKRKRRRSHDRHDSKEERKVFNSL